MDEIKKNVILALEKFVIRVVEEAPKGMATPEEVLVLPEVAKIVLDYFPAFPVSPDNKN